LKKITLVIAVLGALLLSSGKAEAQTLNSIFETSIRIQIDEPDAVITVTRPIFTASPDGKTVLYRLVLRTEEYTFRVPKKDLEALLSEIEQLEGAMRVE